MICPLCQIDVAKSKLIATPLWQATSLELAHKMNPDWNEEDGCCALCFDRIVETIETAWVPTKNYAVKGLSDGYRYVLSEQETGQWNHCNLDLQRWW